jgi:3-oxoacyl-[acyl-carrier protein] reductase
MRESIQKSSPPPRLAVIGGAGAIGRAIVAGAVSAGQRVIVLDLPRSIEAYPPQGVETAIGLDATDAAQVEAAFGLAEQLWDGIDGLVILPGLLRRKQPVEEFSLEDWNEVVAVSLTSTFLAAKFGAPLLRRGHNASIVTMASGLGVRSSPGYGPYAAAKAGVISLTRTLALELAPDIRVNAVAPGLVETAFQRGGTGQPGIDETSPVRVAGVTDAYSPPLGRLALPEDIADTVLFLLGKGAATITGQVIHVNAGSLMA